MCVNGSEAFEPRLANFLAPAKCWGLGDFLGFVFPYPVMPVALLHLTRNPVI